MSFFSELGGRLGKLFDSRRKFAADLEAMRVRLETVENSLRLVGGSAHTPGLNVDAPLVLIQISVPENIGIYQGRQVIIETGGVDAGSLILGKIADVEEDAELYQVEPSPWCPHIFHDSINLCMMAYSTPHPTDPTLPDIAVYRAIAGEGAGFAARITGAPEDSIDGPLYPWQQLWVHEDDALSDTYIGFNGQPLGKARMLSAAAFDPQITADRIAYPATGIQVWMRARQYYGEFVFSAYAEGVHRGCPIV